MIDLERKRERSRKSAALWRKRHPEEAKRISKEQYWKKHDRYLQHSRNRIRERAELIKRVKEQPCMDCGTEYPYYVMDFDHVRGQKTLQIGGGARRFSSMDALIEEILKCEVVCSNCHRERTHQRLMAERVKA